MNKLNLLWILILLLTATAFAESKVCYTNKECEFITTVFDGLNGYYDADEVNTTLISDDGTIIFENITMSKTQTGIYAYNYTINESGTYLRYNIIDGIIYPDSDEEIVVEDFSNEEVAGLSIGNTLAIYMFLGIIIFAIIIFSIVKK
jgi:hypothetical protein